MNKAETLAFIKQQLPQVNVLPVMTINAKHWLDERNCLDQIKQSMGATALVVRSSADDEDTASSSKAGAYTSVLNVCEERDISSAIQQVFSSPHPSTQY